MLFDCLVQNKWALLTFGINLKPRFDRLEIMRFFCSTRYISKMHFFMVIFLFIDRPPKTIFDRSLFDWTTTMLWAKPSAFLIWNLLSQSFFWMTIRLPTLLAVAKADVVVKFSGIFSNVSWRILIGKQKQMASTNGNAIMICWWAFFFCFYTEFQPVL